MKFKSLIFKISLNNKWHVPRIWILLIICCSFYLVLLPIRRRWWTSSSRIRMKQYVVKLTYPSDVEQRTSRPLQYVTDEDLVPNHTKKVFLFAHMRSGSSIVGEVFNIDPNIIMWYEPGDAFFAQYYGIERENLPQHDLYFANMTRRHLEVDELDALREFYSNILTCRYDKLSPDIMGHHFLNYTRAMKGYLRCYRRNSSLEKSADCSDRCKTVCSGKMVEQAISNKCPKVIKQLRKYLQEKQHKSTKAKRIIDVIKTLKIHGIPSKILKKRTLLPMIERELCLQNISSKTGECLQLALDKCSRAHVHVVQVNRMKMEDLEHLMKIHPDLFVIHYVRDPRAIAMSRAEVGLIWDQNDRRPAREAQYLCHRMAEDLKQRKRLEVKYPRQILQVKYEDLMRNPVSITEQMFSFFGERPPSNLVHFVNTSMYGKTQSGSFGTMRKNATETAVKWKYKISWQDLQNMNSYCAEYLLSMNYPLDVMKIIEYKD